MFDFQIILNSSSQIRSYFQTNASSINEYIALTSELLIESIKKRLSSSDKPDTKVDMKQVQKQDKQNMVKTHYNVAYIKHNRFLSPSQKKQITPKVTEIIPVSPDKIKIYGKPKVKLDDGFGCPLHEQQNCQEYQNQHHQHYNLSELNNQYNSNSNVLESEEDQCAELPRQYEEYLSPKNKQKKKGKRSSEVNQTVAIVRSPNGKKHDVGSNRMISPKSMLHQGNQTYPQNYSNVQSKIKELIQRDKRNREMQKQLQNQRRQILQIQQRQNHLLTMQRYQQQMIRRQAVNGQNQVENQTWQIKMTQSPSHFIKKPNLESQPESQSSQSSVNLHGHKDSQSRIKCYQCQIQRLKRRKQKAKKAIKTIEQQQFRRSKLLASIPHNIQLMKDASLAMNRPSEQSLNSVSVSSRNN